MLWVFVVYLSWGAPWVKVEQGPFPTETECRARLEQWEKDAHALSLREKARGVQLSTMDTICFRRGEVPDSFPGG